MANGIGFVPYPDDIVVNRDGTLNIYSVRALQETVFNLIANYNGKVSLGDGTENSFAGNLDAAYTQTVVSPAVANTEFTIKHTLGRVPIGFDVVSRDKPGIIYDWRKQSWTATSMFLKCSTATTTIRLRVY